MAKTISQLRNERAIIIEQTSTLSAAVKALDEEMRAKRGLIDKLRKQERQLTADITKLAKDEL